LILNSKFREWNFEVTEKFRFFPLLKTYLFVGNTFIYLLLEKNGKKKGNRAIASREEENLYKISLACDEIFFGRNSESENL